MSHRHLFILASGSPRRRELLEYLGVPLIVVLPDNPSASSISTVEETTEARTTLDQGGVDETPLADESPTDLVQRLSRAKAVAVAACLASLNLPHLKLASTSTQMRIAIIIAADTIVVLENEIMGKPGTPAEAIHMLKALRDHQYHDVYSGLTVGVWQKDPQEEKKSQDTAPRNDSSLPYNLKLITRLHQSKVWMRAYTDAEIEAYVASGDPMDKAGAYAIQNKLFAPVARLDGCFASVMGLPLGELAMALHEAGVSLPEIAPRCTQYSSYPCCQEMTSQ